MAGHRMEVHQDNEGRWYPTCSCKRVPHTRHLLRWQADDILQAHKQTVERAMTALRRGGTTLKAEYEWAIRMSADPNNPPEERRQWLDLALGYASRLPDPEVVEDSLF